MRTAPASVLVKCGFMWRIPSYLTLYANETDCPGPGLESGQNFHKVLTMQLLSSAYSGWSCCPQNAENPLYYTGPAPGAALDAVVQLPSCQLHHDPHPLARDLRLQFVEPQKPVSLRKLRKWTKILRNPASSGILVRVSQHPVETSREPRPERTTTEGWETRENGKEALKESGEGARAC